MILRAVREGVKEHWGHHRELTDYMRVRSISSANAGRKTDADEPSTFAIILVDNPNEHANRH